RGPGAARRPAPGRRRRGAGPRRRPLRARVVVAMVLRVFRWSPETGSRFEDYPIRPVAGTTVLDALVRLRESHVPDLAFRYACRVGMCGSCAMVVDGRERWAFPTLLAARS